MLFRTYSYQFVNVHTHFHTGEYKLTKIGDGGISHVVNVNGSSNETYTVMLMDKMSEREIKKEPNLTAFEIPFKLLKPCTFYKVRVNGCEPIGDLTFTYSEKGKTVNETVVTSVNDEEVCFKEVRDPQKWNLTKCVKITVNNSCNRIPELIKLDTCSYTMMVNMPPVKPHIYFNQAIPSQFEWTNKPEQCNDNLNIICTHDENTTTYVYNKSVSLLPDKKYYCFGEYPYEKPISSDKLSFKINCATCVTHQTGTGTDCSMEGLEPYTKYSCSITAGVSKHEYTIYTGETETLPSEPLRPVEPIYAENLIEAYKNKIADEGRLFMDEFQSIPRIFSNYTIKEAKKQENQSKNRYVDILPCKYHSNDYNRVPLTTGGEREYINASFIEIKCAQYWPSLDRETEIFEDFVVKIRAEEHCPDYIIRYLVLANKREKAPEREVTHIQFISWPDHGVPQDPSLLLKLRRRVNSFKNFFSGPVVVHCSAGVGRTGTYIGIDAMIESLEAEGRVDIYGFVAKLRRQRCLMVQVEKLPKFKNWRTFNTGSSEDNKKKNRYSSHIPYDFNRVLFRLEIEGNQTSDPEDEDEYSSDEEEESNEYINASFIDGYWCHKSLIAAQGPLPNTTEEFLLMLYQQQTKTLVMLTDCQEDGKDYCSQYWGDEKKVFGDMEIEVKKTESFPAYVRRRLEIQSTKKKDILEVDQYQFLKWRGTELPENAQELIEMMKSIRENGNYDNSKMDRSIPIVVHCNNGSSRTGVFCALWNLMDCVLTEKLVDVFQEIKNLRKMRQGMVETFEQYQFLYTAIEGAFPVQNGAIKTPTATDSAQVINETTALLTEANSTTGADQKEAEDSKATESSEQEATENSTAAPSPAEGDGEKTTTEGPNNGPAATTVEV
ncbi:Receptor-type tyrosine-protein phosphatase C [Anabarilius grahami]|uniref:protein-tyrosine-phosphatase n=1 Tax=Anabarilius grahami TaxID=495550 RepID=A0A3N0Y3I7_ANAGA|nr:Receptor-type tyrosine-protein phosphatase C [Anabarilius grahami]